MSNDYIFTIFRSGGEGAAGIWRPQGLYKKCVDIKLKPSIDFKVLKTKEWILKSMLNAVRS